MSARAVIKYFCKKIMFRKEIHDDFFENGVLLMYKLVGVSSVANFITAYEESQ